MNHYIFKYSIEKIKSEFLNKRVRSVVAYSSSFFSLGFAESSRFIYISLSAPNSFVYPFCVKYETSFGEMSPFLAFLRKKIVGCRLVEIEQNFSERVATMIFEDSRGKIINKFSLILEVMDRNPNAVLTDEKGVVLQAYKYLESRNIYPRKKYIQPSSNMPDLLRDDLNVLLMKYKHGEDILGLSPRLRKLINTEEEFVEFVRNLRRVFLEREFDLCMYLNDVYPFCFFEGGKHIKEEFLFDFFVVRPQKNDFKNRKNSFLALLRRKLNSLKRRLTRIEEDLKEAEKFEIYRVFAENLMARPYLETRYKEKVEVEDIYSGTILKIPINPKLDLFENAQNYFKRYKKARNSVDIIKERIEQTKVEIGFLEQLIFDAEMANTHEELQDIRKIAEEEGVLKKHIKDKPTKFKPYEHIKIEGFDAYIGKNARGNDIVALKLSKKDDFWFHAKEKPSAHLIVKVPSKLKDLPESVKIKAAKIVACRTRALDGEKVAVDFTKVKFLRKPKGFKAGMIIYTNFKTIVVEKNGCG